MQTTTARRSGPRGVRKTRLLAIAGVLAAAVAVPLAGTAVAAPSSELVPGTPCHVGTAACVRLGSQGFNGKAWFIRDQRVVKGPVPVATGGPGEDTSVGTFPVTTKDADHVSSETTDAEGNPSEMPYSVFFGRRGEAFHGGGDPTARTAGCVRLRDSDASYFYHNLNPGDQVEVVSSSAASSSDDEPEDRGNDNNHRSGGLLGGL